jgi:DNA-directed RNA polymerase specialized sigma24 family protein
VGPTIAGGMGSPDGDLAHERAAVERARGGDHRAFVELYRQDAPPAWRLAVALTGDPRRAEDAVAEGFRRTLAPLRAALPRSEVAFRVRLLAATRHAVLDGAAAPPTATAPLSSAAAAEGTRSTGKGRAAEAMAAFAAPPEGWRTILWLVVVEGLGTLDAARVLDPTPVEAEALTERAQAGLRAQWRRDREADGTAAPVFPAHLDRELQPVLPSPSGSSTP